MDKKTLISVDQLDPYSRFQLEKYGNILPPVDTLPKGEEIEAGENEKQRFAEWTNYNVQQELFEYENQYR